MTKTYDFSKFKGAQDAPDSQGFEVYYGTGMNPGWVAHNDRYGWTKECGTKAECLSAIAKAKLRLKEWMNSGGRGSPSLG